MRPARGASACPRCVGLLRDAADDAGVELAAYDRPPVKLGLPGSLAVDAAAVDLQRLARKLRPARLAAMPAREPEAAIELIRPSMAPRDDEPVLWGPTLVLLAGFAALVGAVAAVGAHAAGHATVEVWRWGLAAALGGEGLLAGGFAWIASRLWRNNRRLNRRVDIVERQLAQQAAATERRVFSSRAA
jgi:hypothetical protein